MSVHVHGKVSITNGTAFLELQPSQPARCDTKARPTPERYRPEDSRWEHYRSPKQKSIDERGSELGTGHGAKEIRAPDWDG